MVSLAVVSLVAGAWAVYAPLSTIVAPREANVPDSDLDLVGDIAETGLLGTDPQAPAAQDSLPEWWILRHGLDVGDPLLPERLGAAPPSTAVPAAYGPGGLPAEFRLTLGAVFAYGLPADADEDAWIHHDNGLDPGSWDYADSGVPYGWLIRFDLDPRSVNLAAPAPGANVPWTVGEAWTRGLSPLSLDWDEDGLRDDLELDLGSSPRLQSTAGTGIADGWLHVHGFDLLDPAIAHQDPDRDGLTNLEEFQASLRLFGTASLEGGGLDPHRQSTVGGPIPDGWLVRHGLHPLRQGVEGTVTQTHPTDQGVQLTVFDEYRVNRPPSWNESLQGPWWGGTDPNLPDTDGDGLDDVVEIRGWVIQTADGPKRVRSDPTRTDTDGDGLTDAQEHEGRVGGLVFSPTDPGSPDSDADGLTDGQELGMVPWEGMILPGTDPNNRDTDADGLQDGAEAAYWLSRHRDLTEQLSAPYAWGPDPRPTTLDALAWAGLPTERLMEALLPAGDMDGDGIRNLVDPDSDNDGLLDGWEVDPKLYQETPHASARPRPATDPANPDTDLDGLPDAWEVEHGLWDETSGVWNLNPAAWSSFGDAVGDGDRDLDDDAIAWYSYHASGEGVRAVAHTFVATNAVEYEYGSNPNQLSSSPDGLNDAWKIFWGTIYLALAPEERGIIYPGAPGPLAIPHDRPLPQVGRADSWQSAEQSYRRFQPLDVPSVLPWERVESVAPDFQNARQVQAPHRVIVGSVTYNYHAAVQNQTNPYLDDTDGDDMPDAWEGVWARLGDSRARVSPVLPDGGADPDLDGVPNRLEAVAGTDPYRADTDFGGSNDWDEIRLNLDPLSPHDDHLAFDQDLDSDEDGIPDTQELLGRPAGPSRRKTVTDPFHPDTDRDGLIDGPSLRDIVGRKLRLDEPGDLEIIQAFRQQGLLVLTYSDGTADVPGEDAFSSDPSKRSTSGEGVPDGWLVKYGLSPLQLSGQYPAYAHGRPEWWNDDLDGVWWGGLRPGQAAMRDLDRDGLDDWNGEDPVPFANTRNELPEGSPLDPDLSSAERLRRSQAYVAVNLSMAVPARAEMVVRLDPVGPSVATNGTTEVRGNVTTGGNPARNVTVLVSLAYRDLVIGVATTNETGGFRANLTLASSTPAPPESAGVPVFGRLDGAGVHVNPPHLLLALDPATPIPLFAWTYNVSHLPPPRQDHSYARPDGSSGPGLLGNQSAARFVRVEVPTLVALTVPASVEVDQGFTLNVSVRDGLGRPVAKQPLRFHPWDLTLTTDALGYANVTMPALEGVGSREIRVEFPGSGALLPSQATVEVLIRRPTRLVVLDPLEVLHPGEEFGFQGTLRTLGNVAVPNATVRVALAGTTTPVVTDEGGRFRLVLEIPINHSGASRMVAEASFAGNDTLVPSNASSELKIRGRPVLEVVGSSGFIERPPPVRARLLGSAGLPIADAQVVLYSADQLVATNRTDADGWVELPTTALAGRPGTHTLLVRFEHVDLGQAEASALVTLRVQPVWSLAGAEGTRGANLEVSGRFSLPGGAGLSGQRVEVEAVGSTVHAITDRQGALTIRIPVGPDILPGVTRIAVRYPGSSDGIYLPLRAEFSARVLDQPRLTLLDHNVSLTNPYVQGRLTNLVGEPLSREVVVLKSVWGETAVVTQADGAWGTTLPFSDEVSVGPLEVRIQVRSTEERRGLNETKVLTVRDVGRVLVQMPSFVIRGGEVSVSVRVEDSLGRTVGADLARVSVFLDEAPLSSAAAPGKISIGIPPDVDPGLHSLRVTVESDWLTARAALNVIEVRRPTALQLLGYEAATSGQLAKLRVLLTAENNPLDNRVIRLDGAAGVALFGSTDGQGVATFLINQPPTDDFSLDVVFEGGETDAGAAMRLQARAPAEPSLPSVTRVPWILMAVGLGLLAVGIVVVMVARARTPAHAISAMAKRLRSPDADFHTLYEGYLQLVALAGLKPDEEERLTFRGVVDRLLPRVAGTEAETAVLSDIYDRAVYAQHLLVESDLVRAADALERLAAQASSGREETA